MRWQAVRFIQNNVQGYLVNIKASEVQKLVNIDQKTSSNPKGYQRPQSPSRVKQFQKFMQHEKSFCPVPLVANIRLNEGSLNFDEKKGILNLKGKDVKLWICEGQHRYWGYISLYEENEVDVEIPFVIVNQEREWEIANFFIINKKQKAIPTDLAEIAALDYQSASGNPIFGVSIADTRATAISITNTLNKKAGPFYKRIDITGNDVKSTIKANSFHVAIEEVVKASNKVWTHNEVEKKSIEIINNGWKAVMSLLPEATGENCKDYVVLKTAGIFVFNRILAESIDSLNNFDMTTENDYHVLFASDEMRDFMDDAWWHSRPRAGTEITAVQFGSSQGSFRRILERMMVQFNLAIKNEVQRRLKKA